MKLSYILPVIVFFLFACSTEKKTEQEMEEPHNFLYGIDTQGYEIENHIIEKGETFGEILSRNGIGQSLISKTAILSKNIMPLRLVRAGNRYTTFTVSDSLSSRLEHLVYENSITEYTIFSYAGDSVSVCKYEKDVTLKRQKSSATISTSLWGSIMEEKLPFALAAEMEDIYQWTVDFFGIQKGDSFTVIYDEKFVDTLSVGIGRIWGAKFHHGGKDIYAIPFLQDGKVKYWEWNGASLRKQLLKAPLKFTRISSKFSNARYHPVLKVYRPHHGVDYAAPTGTPVRAVADGTITYRANSGAGGLMIKIKHPGGLQSGYMHLSRFGKGTAVGRHIQQGEVIGYVGSTGRSTGPHLDFRLWKNGKPINPLKVPQQPAVPIAKKDMKAFEWLRDRISAELEGEVPDSMKIVQLDSLKID